MNKLFENPWFKSVLIPIAVGLILMMINKSANKENIAPAAAVPAKSAVIQAAPVIKTAPAAPATNGNGKAKGRKK